MFMVLTSVDPKIARNGKAIVIQGQKDRKKIVIPELGEGSTF
jgi:hypothetical protein